jgi:ATP-dependent RNA helicase DeaD
VKLIATAGRHEGIEAADLIAGLTAGGLDGSAIRNVRILERFALVEVPTGSAPEVVSVRGREVALEPIRN